MGSQLYVDQYNVLIDETNLQNKFNTLGSDTSQVSQLQTQYDNDLNTYKADLTSAANSPTLGYQATPGSSDTGRTWAQDELNNLNSRYAQPMFADSASAAGPQQRTDGSGFPGARLGSNAAPTNVPAGYVAPPAITSASGVSAAYHSMTPAQSAYLGWAIAQGNDKQLTVPAGDAQAWSALAQYAVANNYFFVNAGGETSSDPRFADDGRPQPNDTTQDAYVYESFKNIQENQHIGKQIGEFAGDVLAFVPLPGVDLAGLASGAADAVRTAFSAVGEGGDIASDLATNTVRASAGGSEAGVAVAKLPSSDATAGILPRLGDASNPADAGAVDSAASDVKTEATDGGDSVTETVNNQQVEWTAAGGSAYDNAHLANASVTHSTYEGKDVYTVTGTDASGLKVNIIGNKAPTANADGTVTIPPDTKYRVVAGLKVAGVAVQALAKLPADMLMGVVSAAARLIGL